MKPSTLLKDVDFNFEEDEESLGPHVALTFKFQGGAASGYNKPLLFKSQELEITPELIDKLKDLGVEPSEINKALSYNNKQRLLSAAFDEKDFLDRWDYYYITDFDDSNIIVCTDEGMFAVGYTMDGLNVTLDDIGQPVVAISDYQVVDGDVLISEDARNSMKDELQSLVMKSSFEGEIKEKVLASIKDFSEKEKNSVIKSEDKKSEEKPSELINKDKNNGDHKVDLNEILKSAEFQDLLKAKVAEATASKEAEKEELEKSLKAEKARVDALVKAEETRITKAYTDVVKSFSFVEEEKVEALVKALISDAENSGLIVEVLTKAADEIAEVKEKFAVEKGHDVKGEGKKGPHDNILKAAEALKALQK